MILFIATQLFFGLVYGLFESFLGFGLDEIIQLTPFFIIALVFFLCGFFLYKLPRNYYFLTLIVPAISLVYGIVKSIYSIKNINFIIASYGGSYTSWWEHTNNEAFFTTLGAVAWIAYILFFTGFIYLILYEMRKK